MHFHENGRLQIIVCCSVWLLLSGPTISITSSATLPGRRLFGVLLCRRFLYPFVLWMLGAWRSDMGRGHYCSAFCIGFWYVGSGSVWHMWELGNDVRFGGPACMVSTCPWDSWHIAVVGTSVGCYTQVCFTYNFSFGEVSDDLCRGVSTSSSRNPDGMPIRGRILPVSAVLFAQWAVTNLPTIRTPVFLSLPDYHPW